MVFLKRWGFYSACRVVFREKCFHYDSCRKPVGTGLYYMWGNAAWSHALVKSCPESVELGQQVLCSAGVFREGSSVRVMPSRLPVLPAARLPAHLPPRSKSVLWRGSVAPLELSAPACIHVQGTRVVNTCDPNLLSAWIGSLCALIKICSHIWALFAGWWVIVRSASPS